MAESRGRLHMEMEAAQILQEMAKVVQKTKEHEAALKKLGGESQKLTKKEKEHAREVKRAFEEIRGPQERYKRGMRALNELVSKGKITQREYADAVRRSKDRLDSAGRAGVRAFGPQALAQVKSMALGYIGVSQAISAVVSLLRKEKQLRDEIADQQVTSAASLGKLAQLTRPLPELKQGAVELGRAGGAADLKGAAQTVFELESAGLFGQRKQAAQLFDIAGEGELPNIIKSLGKIQAGFKGGDPTGNVLQMVSKGLAAAGPVTGVGISEILQATGEVAGTAKQLGLTDEEAMAAISVMSQVFSPQEAKTAVERMLQNIAIKRPELAGKPLKEILTTIKAEKPSAKEAARLFGVRGLRAQQRLATGGGVDLFLGRLGGVEQAQRDLSVIGDIQEARDDPHLVAARARRIEEFNLEVAGERMGAVTNRVKAGIARAEAKKRAQDRPLAGFGTRVGGEILRSIYGDEAVAEGEYTGIRGRIVNPAPGLGHLVGQTFLKLSSVADELSTASKDLSQAARQRPVQERN